MKSKFRLFSVFAAFACVLASDFARGEEEEVVVAKNISRDPELVYKATKDKNDEYFNCVSNAIAEARANEIIALREKVAGVAGLSIVIDKEVHLNTGIASVDGSALMFQVVMNGVLHVDNDTTFLGVFNVDGGTLHLNRGTFYSDGVHPIVSTLSGSTNTVIVNGATLSGVYEKTRSSTLQSKSAVQLEGFGSFRMENGAKIEPFIYDGYADDSYTTIHVKNVFNTGIVLNEGEVFVDGSSISVKDYGISTGKNAFWRGEGGISLLNKASIASDGSGIYAIASGTSNQIRLSVVDTTISSLYSGVKLGCSVDADFAPTNHTIFLDGDTTITTRSTSDVYAIDDKSLGADWSVTIKRGKYYRMNKTFGSGTTLVDVEKDWLFTNGVNVSVAKWDPSGRDTDLTLTVTCDQKDEINVVFNGDGGYEYGFDGNVVTNFLIAHGGSKSLAEVTPELIGWTNSMGVFAGWYDSVDNARALTVTGKVTAVSKSMTLYAGWKPCVVTFYTQEDDFIGKTGLAQRVSNGQVSVVDIKPSTFGYENPGQSFVGWYLDKDYSGSSITSLSVPVATNLYARWVEKSGVAWIEGTTNTYKTVAEAIAAAGTNVVVLIADVKDEAPIVVSNSTGIALNGYALGDAGRAADIILDIRGPDADLTIFSEGGTVYGTISVGDNAWLQLEGGTYVCKEGMVISAGGTNFNVLATDAVFKGPKGEVTLDFAGSGGCAILSNSTVACESAGAVDIAINVENCEVQLVGSKVTAEYSGLMVSNGTCTVEKSTISAMMSIKAYPSTIKVSDSTITSTSTNGIDEAYAFYLEAGPKGFNGCKLELRGENTVVGGVYDTSRTHAFLKGGAFYYEGIWADALKCSIWGGTYSHQMSNEVVMAWIATNCTCVWESETRFTVTDPNANYTITYDLWTNLPKDAQTAVNEGTAILTNHNPKTYGPGTKYLEFKDARCTGEDGYKCDFMGWYLSDGVNSNQVVAISNGCVVVKVNGKSKLTDVTGSLSLVAKWGNWAVLPCSVSFASGVVIKEVDEDDPEFVTYHEVDLTDEDDMKANGVAISKDFPVDGLEYHVGDKSITLPSGITREGHTLSGWALYDPDDITDPEYPPETTNFFNVGEIELSKFVDSEGNLLDGVTLHAVWDQGGKSAGLDNFDDLYNEERDPVMPGGDTYVGAILDGEQVLGTITVKCGVPNGKGEVSITATVKTAEGGTVTFRGKGFYNGETIDVDLMNGDHSLSLTLDSKSIQSGSQYDNYYDIRGGVNKFKGSQEDKDEGDLRLKHWLGKWMIIFATESAEDQDTGKENGSAHAYGYSYVVLDIKDKGLVSVSGKLANGKEVSSTATAIIGDTGVCVPVVCSIYSGYDWFALYALARNYGMRALVPEVANNFRTTTSRGGFGFTAWFSNSETNLLELASEDDSLIVNNVSAWDTSYDKSMPFTATVVPTNAQRVADIKLPGKMVFYVDKYTDFGWMWNANDENIGDLTEGVYYIPSLADDVPNYGYIQTVTVSASTNETCSMKADGKATKMKLVDADGTPYIVPSKNGSNFSALKLKYNQKNGVFTGSFKIYSLKTDFETDKTSLKATKVTVSGGIADGRGYGFSHSSAVGSQPVMLIPVGDATPLEPEDGGDGEEGDGGEEDDEDWDMDE